MMKSVCDTGKMISLNPQNSPSANIDVCQHLVNVSNVSFISSQCFLDIYHATTNNAAHNPNMVKHA